MQMSTQQGDSNTPDGSITPREGSSSISKEKPQSSNSSSSQASSSSSAVPAAGGATPRGLGEQLQQAVVRILPPAEAPRVISLMFKFMYMEGRLAADGVES